MKKPVDLYGSHYEQVEAPLYQAVRVEAFGEDLCELEGETKFQELQSFLETVHTLASERRLSRFAYLGEKPERAVSIAPE